MSRKWRLFAWIIYTIVGFLVMIIGFNWMISLSVSIIVGFICGLFNEIIQILLSIQNELHNKLTKDQ